MRAHISALYKVRKLEGIVIVITMNVHACFQTATWVPRWRGWAERLGRVPRTPQPKYWPNSGQHLQSQFPYPTSLPRKIKNKKRKKKKKKTERRKKYQTKGVSTSQPVIRTNQPSQPYQSMNQIKRRNQEFVMWRRPSRRRVRPWPSCECPPWHSHRDRSR